MQIRSFTNELATVQAAKVGSTYSSLIFCIHLNEGEAVDHTHTPINLSVKIKEHVMSNGFLELVDRMELKPKDAMEILKFSHCT
jgi:hypothetical protein